MKRSLSIFGILCGLLAATATAQVAIKYQGSTGNRTEPSAYKVPTGFSDTYNAGSTLTINGTLSGTPTAGALNLSNVTVSGLNAYQPLHANLTAIAAALPNIEPALAVLTQKGDGTTAAAPIWTPVAGIVQPKLVATNSAPMTCIGLTTTTAITARARHVITSHVFRLQFRYDSIQNGTADGEVSFLNQIEITAAVELPDGTICSLFFNGKRLALLQRGATLYTDPIDVELEVGDVIYSRTFSSRLASSSYTTAKGETGQLAADQTYLFYNYTVRGDSALNNNGESVKYTAATGVDPFLTDATLTAGALPTTTGANYCFIPSAIIGDTDDTAAGAIILGTSIEKGAGDQWIDNAALGGWAARACNELGIGVCNLAVGSSNYTDHWKAKSRTSAIRGTMAKHARIAIMGGPTNDIGTYYADVPAIKAAMLAVANRLADQGLVVFCDTAQPHTTSTDGWVTLANQTTLGASETARQEINTWLRTVPAPFVACLDTASVVEDSATGKWLAPVGGVLASGTCTSGTAVYRLVDSGAAFPVNGYAGYIVRNTSVADTAYILFNSTTTIDISGLSVGLSSGQGYAIYAGLTYDGLHCTGAGHELKSDKAKAVLSQYLGL